MEQGQSRFGPLQYGIILLTLTTALIHISLLFPDTLFILNGLGYLVLLAALYLPTAQLQPYRDITRWLLIAYTAVTLIIWIFIGSRGPLAYTTKIVEAVLIVLLWLEGQRSSAKSS